MASELRKFFSPTGTSRGAHETSEQDHGGIVPAAPSRGGAALPKDDTVVSSLSNRSSHPYSSISLSPDRQLAITACKDTLQIVAVQSSGLAFVKSIPITSHFSATTPKQGRFTANADSDMNFIDAFGFGGGMNSSAGTGRSAAGGTSEVTVVITDVAWSNTYGNDTSMIAAAASNGVIVVWNATSLLQDWYARSKKASPVMANNTSTKSQQSPVASAVLPEAVLSQHSRAVNRLAWHPKLPMLLSASQDATVVLWERRRQADDSGSAPSQASEASVPTPEHGIHRWFGNKIRPNAPLKRTYSWHLRKRYEPKCEAVRDIQWSPFFDDVFALVTSSGSLIAYNRHVPPRALVKLTAHSGEAITLDWHPRKSYVVATGGARDRTVKVWDLEAFLNLDIGGTPSGAAASSNLNLNSSTISSIGTDDSSETDRSSLSLSVGHTSTIQSQTHAFRQTVSPSSNLNTLNSASRHKSSTIPKAMLHVLAISASVTRLRWRPPSQVLVMNKADGDSDALDLEDLHDVMMAVATAPIKGASAGGAGVLALWSIHRPFMPLSVLQGHSEGAVTDFEWLETPQIPARTLQGVESAAASVSVTSTSRLDSKRKSSGRNQGASESSFPSDPTRSGPVSRVGSGSTPFVNEHLLHDSVGEVDDDMLPFRIWQHAISVGRDSHCLVQSFVRGDRPISKVPPSCFAMANLSPFQKGYGSLQLFSVSQRLPSDPESEFFLTGLRRDSVTASAPGVFREVQLDDQEEESPLATVTKPNATCIERFPESSPELLFTVVDQGDLDEDSTPIEPGGAQPITVAPEVVHLSRFAAQYALYPSDQFPTQSSLCLHNSHVAERMRCSELAHLWRMVASLLKSNVSDANKVEQVPCNVMASDDALAFVAHSVIINLLVERAEQGDVQTCVALCEVLQVVQRDQTVQLPGLDINLVREWYISYIDLLRDMCLFSHASFLIQNSNDPFIAALNQQSTTIHEACPRCGKPIMGDGSTRENGGTARRVCNSCRRRVGLCFLCHEPVKGVYVWCPGCGHGGHLEHALQWFGGMSGKPVREVCPTGCGHKCNMLQQLLSFPRTESLNELGVADSLALEVLPPGIL